MKLLIAIISKDDRAETERRLTSEGFMLTVIGTTGGFLKKKNVTLLIGTSDDKAARVRDILKDTAGRRSIRYYQSGAGPMTNQATPVTPVTPVESETGGCTVFEVSSDKMYKF